MSQFLKIASNWHCPCLRYSLETKKTHRYLASYFQLYKKETDPYWDPPGLQLVGTTCLSLEPLFYKLQYEGDLSIVKKGDKIGKMHVKIHPTDSKKITNISE